MPEEPTASPMAVDDDDVEEVYIEDGGTSIEVTTFKVDDYLEKKVLVDLDQMDECNHPL